MKAAQERAEEIYQQLCHTTDSLKVGVILLALLEQDKITRHMCAEAVLECGNADESHAACINVQAI
jgi:hypothetical protein